MKIAYFTLGCKVNQYETQAIREEAEDRGHTTVSDVREADAVILNSCTVTAESDRKTRQLLRRCRRLNPTAVTVLTGCMVQAFPEESAALCEADLVIGNTEHRRILSLTENFFADHRRTVSVKPHENGEPFDTPAISDFSERTRAYMKIEDGCDRFCSYCIIPFARGRVRSRALEEIRAEACRLAAGGYREIVLVGINLSAYGKGETFDLCDAVETVCATDGIERVRLGSLEPDHISDAMLSRLQKQPKFCPQFHLSLQSGCDATLKRMNRHYDAAFYEDLVCRIRRLFPDAAVTTDIMVGFAGETEREFAESLAFAQKIGFAKAHVFAYSRRTGTVAAALEDQVTRTEKESRSRRMIEATAESEARFLKQQCGKVFPVLFENASKGVAEGYTPNYTRVTVKTEEPHIGQILPVLITEAEKDHCIGIIREPLDNNKI